MSQLLKEILKLSPSERIMMAESIWDSLEDKEIQIGVSAETKQLLEKRLELHHKDPEKGSPWSDVKGRIKKQL